MDYLKKLSDEELRFLNQFMGEYVSGAFKKNDSGEYSSVNFHKTAEERRECYTRNNTRNRCGLTVSNATGKTYRCDDIYSFLEKNIGEDFETVNSNDFSNMIFDDYEGDYTQFELEIVQQQLKDFKRCINPKNKADENLLNSNYGKSLLLKFKDVKLIEED